MFKRNEVDAENDNFHVTGYRELAKSIISKVITKGNIEDFFIIATCFLKEVAREKIKNEKNISLIKGPFEKTPQKNLLDFV